MPTARSPLPRAESSRNAFASIGAEESRPLGEGQASRMSTSRAASRGMGSVWRSVDRNRKALRPLSVSARVVVLLFRSVNADQHGGDVRKTRSRGRVS